MRTAKFGNGLRVLTGSDDSTVKVWDLPTSTRLFSLTDSTDYVRSQSSSPASMHIWMTGSADRKARIYDLRTRKPIIVLDHGSQVDDVCILPGGVRAVTIGGPYVKVWDFLNGGKVLHTPFSHSKGVTCGVVNVRNNSLATAGLDGFMKVYDLATFRAKGSMSFGGQILSMAVSGDGGRYAVGTNEGNVEVRSVGRKSHAVNNSKHVSPFKERDFEGWGRGVTRVDEPSGPFPGSRRYFERGAGVKPSQDDLVVRKNRKLKLAEYDKHLKKFEVGLALDEALNEGSPGVVVAVVEELTVRGVLKGALAGREVEDLLPMLGVIRRHVRNPTYTDRLVYFLNVILDMYGGEFGRHEMADKELSNVLKEVKAELKTCIEMNCLRGTVELIIASV